MLFNSNSRFSAKAANRQMGSIITTTQPLPATPPVHFQPRFNPMGQIRPPQQHQQIPPNYQARPQMIALVAAPPQQLTPTQQQQPSVESGGSESKIVARYMCNECFKFYACRKNVRTHRINSHQITEEQADANPAKRVKVRSDTGFIITPGFDRENVMLQQRSRVESILPTVVKSGGQPKAGGKRNSK